jgi:hypothetical protein
MKPLKRFLPYFLSYLIVASGVAAYTHLFMLLHGSGLPPNSVIVVTTLSQDELAAKLQQIGLPEASVQTFAVKPVTLYSVVHSFIFDAVMFAAFLGLAYLFRRVFPADVRDRDPVASCDGSSVKD